MSIINNFRWRTDMRKVIVVFLSLMAFAQPTGVAQVRGPRWTSSYDGTWWKDISRSDKHSFVLGLLEGFRSAYDVGYDNCVLRVIPYGIPVGVAEETQKRLQARPEFLFDEPVSTYVSQVDVFYNSNPDLVFLPTSMVVWRMANGARADKDFADAIREMLRKAQKP